MEDWIKWGVGMAVTIGGLLFTGAAAIKKGDDVLHARISKVKDDYVRRADLDGHIKRLEENVKELRNDMRHQSEETNKRLDMIISGFSKK